MHADVRREAATSGNGRQERGYECGYVHPHPRRPRRPEVGVRIGSLFAGIGGLELGLEWAGVGHTVFQVERDPYCQQVLARHWPDAARYDDVRAVGAHNLESVDVICGGFPCPPFSSANTKTRADATGTALGLWREFARIIQELEPRHIVVENVASGWRLWLPHVRRDLWRLGYTCLPFRVSASDVGAPFGGPRVFAVATSNRDGESVSALHAEASRVPEPADARRAHWRSAPSESLGVADGVPHRVDRLRALGNAVVPQVAEVVGRRLLAIDAALRQEHAV